MTLDTKDLPSIAIGTWAWGEGAIGSKDVFGNSASTENLKPVFDAALAAGFNLFDTAAVYGMGASESTLGHCLEGIDRSQVLLSTKFTPQMASDSESPIEDMFSDSAKRLGTDYIDIYWIHNPSDVQKWTEKIIPLAKSGKVGAIGVSNHNFEELKQAQSILEPHGLKVSAVQNHFSLLHRDYETAGVLDYCRENKIVFFSYLVLEQGALGGKYGSKSPFPADSQRGHAYNSQLEQIDVLVAGLRHVAEAHGASVAQVATAWAIAKGTLPIVGVTKLEQIQDISAIASLNLTEDEIKQLEDLASSLDFASTRQWEKPLI